MQEPAEKATFETVVGLEVHVQLNTQTKIFSADGTAFGAEPNAQISAVTLALPGTLPKLNRNVIEKAVRIGLALNCTINQINAFDRKHYFYADLPKGYQITQDQTPICVNGILKVWLDNGTEKKIRINRIHLEEDAGKSIHDQDDLRSLSDFNRAGIPLIEIVTEPDIRTAEEAAAFVSEIRQLIRQLDVGDGNMEEGSLRCDANISVRKIGSETFGTRCEVKNLNSIRNLRRAIAFESARQVDLLEQGADVVQSTLNFDAEKGTTSPMRTKEEANDYRYFADPDLPPISISDEWLLQMTLEMPVLQSELITELCKEIGISRRDAQLIAENPFTYSYFREACEHVGNNKSLVNWMNGPLRAMFSSEEIELKPNQLSVMINLVDDGKITQQQVLQKLIPAFAASGDGDVLATAKKLNLLIDHDEALLDKQIEQVLSAFESEVETYKRGKKGLLGLFVGEVMKLSKGSANPKLVNELIKKKLE